MNTLRDTTTPPCAEFRLFISLKWSNTTTSCGRPPEKPNEKSSALGCLAQVVGDMLYSAVANRRQHNYIQYGAVGKGVTFFPPLLFQEGFRTNRVAAASLLRCCLELQLASVFGSARRARSFLVRRAN